MKNIIVLLAAVIVCGMITPASAQTTIRTESGEALLVDNRVPMDSPYEKHLVRDRRALPYDHIREADVFWEKRVWRVIDVREKMNKPFIWPENPFVSVLMRGIESGDVRAYSTLDDKFTTPMSGEEVMRTLNSTDTITTFDPDTYEEKIKVIRNDFNPEDVKRFRIKESWFFDEETSTMQVRILGIAPLKEEYDDNGNLKFEYPMFWIYYPHIRTYLANEEAFNPLNDAHRMSWEDILEARFFASYITKESNVHDRRIQDYKAGVDALYESQKIQDKIFNFEHDLWSY